MIFYDVNRTKTNLKKEHFSSSILTHYLINELQASKAEKNQTLWTQKKTFFRIELSWIISGMRVINASAGSKGVRQDTKRSCQDLSSSDRVEKVKIESEFLLPCWRRDFDESNQNWLKGLMASQMIPLIIISKNSL